MYFLQDWDKDDLSEGDSDEEENNIDSTNRSNLLFHDDELSD